MKTTREIEQAIHEAIDDKDERILQSYAQHVSGEVDAHTIEAICFGLLVPAKRGACSDLMAIIIDRAPDLALGLLELEQIIDKWRADFMACEADRISKQAVDDDCRRDEMESAA